MSRLLINKLYPYVTLILIVILLSSCKSTTSTAVDVNQIEISHQSSLMRDLAFLSSDELEGRKVGTKGNKQAREYIVTKLKSLDIKPLGAQFEHSFDKNTLFKKTSGTNVIGVIEGTKFPKKYIILSAHFDHIGHEGRRIFNGADDNASGTAALLEFAKRLKVKTLNYSVIFLFTDAEEFNLSGAKAFVQDNKAIVDNTVLNMNFDMIAGDRTTRYLRYIERNLATLLTSNLQAKWQALLSNSDVTVKKGFKSKDRFDASRGRIRWEIASDHGAFYREKIPFIYYGVGTHKNYHKSTDTYQNVNHQFYQAAVNTIFKQIVFIDQHI